MDAVDANISNSQYGIGLCGPIEYSIRTGDNLSTDIVRYEESEGGKLVFEPQLFHPPGVYVLKLKATLRDYQWITAEAHFNVEVFRCQARIKSDRVAIPDQSIIWYDNPQQLPVAQMLGQYYQEPNCEYPFAFSMYKLDGDNLSRLPREIEYVPAQRAFVYSKCSQLSLPGDGECAGMVPYTKNHRIVVQASLPDAPSETTNENVDFLITFEDPCPYDAISIPAATAIQSFTYELSTGRQPLTKTPEVSHKFPECPLSCDLYADEAGTLVDYPQEIVYGWNPMSVQFFSEDKLLHDRTFALVIQCRIDDRAYSNTAENRFAVTVFDECLNTQISPLASRETYDVPLYFFDEHTFNQAGQTKPSCEAVQHQLKLVDTNAETPALFFINEFTGMIEVDPQMEEEVGRYSFAIEACVSVQLGLELICATSPIFDVEVTHSCLKTQIVQIVAHPIYTVMSEGQLGYQELLLQDEMLYTGWPWTDTLSL